MQIKPSDMAAPLLFRCTLRWRYLASLIQYLLSPTFGNKRGCNSDLHIQLDTPPFTPQTKLFKLWCKTPVKFSVWSGLFSIVSLHKLNSIIAWLISYYFFERVYPYNCLSRIFYFENKKYFYEIIELYRTNTITFWRT